MEVVGLEMTFKMIATEVEHEIQWGASDDLSLAVESTSCPGESDGGFCSSIGMHIGHIESTPQTMAELRDSKYAEY